MIGQSSLSEPWFVHILAC